MRRRVLLDTGPLVAFLNRRDNHHAWARRVLGEIEPPLYTCESVLSEACFLLRHSGAGQHAVLELVEKGLVLPVLDSRAEAPALRRLLRRYADLPASLADVGLVRLAELFPDSSVLTTDAHFHVYRKEHRKVIPLISPETSH